MNQEHLIAYIDGASRGNPGHAALAVVVFSGEVQIAQRASYLGVTTNNVAEYSALLEALAELRRLGARSVEIRTDSELLVKQINGQYRVKSDNLRALYINAMRMLNEFDSAVVRHVPREENKVADSLANKVLDSTLEARAVL